MSANHTSAPERAAAIVTGVAVNLFTMDEAMAAMQDRLAAGEGFCLATLNLDHLVKLRESTAFRRAYRQMDYITADGWPIAWAASRHGAAVSRTTGADMIVPCVRMASDIGVALYVVGPDQATQTIALEQLRRLYPSLRIAGAEAPIIAAEAPQRDAAAIARRIEASGARLCFLCLGAPKQEILAQALRELCPQVGFLSLGAGLNFIAGTTQRAPEFIQHLKLEWFWRIAQEPRRLAWRYARCGFMFGLILLGKDPVPNELWRHV